MTNKKPTTTVCWRLPKSMIDKLGPTGIRKLLERWRKSRRRVRSVEVPETLVNCCYRMPDPLLLALETEAARLSRATGVTWSVARVVREIWRTATSK